MSTPTDGSPFLDVPAAEHVAANRSAFAIRDRFPVTPGHTLVIPRRLIATWWEASDEERKDLSRLIDEVKAALDAELAPDGYNVGFNAGAAAGQTVGHLHLHVIPRHHGDMPDPRGGVRHVIPSKGNYLVPAPIGADAPTAEPDLVDRLESELLPLLRAGFANVAHDRIEIVVSFVKRSGIELLLPDLRDALGRATNPATIRLLTTDYLGITEPAALEQLHDLAQDHADGGDGRGRVELRVHLAGGRSFHPKAYVFHSSVDPSIARSYVGSSNLTRSGLSGGIEWNVGFDAVGRTRRSFARLWDDPASRPLDRALLDHLASLPRPAPVAWKGEAGARTLVEIEAPVDAADKLDVVGPHDIQREALAALERTREDGRTAALVVMATGLGKTYLAAFDALATGADRLLFVAHRDEILQQSRDAFRAVFPEASMGLFTGAERAPDARMVFASVQSLVNHLGLFAPNEFDYLVVDEFHHAAASSYRRVIEHFRPRFKLGLTATPERMDGADILGLCQDNRVFSCDLVEGIGRERLAPFTYHGLSDPTDYAVVPWRRGRFDEEALERAVATEERARVVHDGWKERRGSRTLAFCVSVRHADFMAEWFHEQGVRAAAVHSGPTSAPRAASVRALDDGELDVLFAVDVFNEGLDVPSIDTVLMLRPTSSPVIFLQQLGRGLRRQEGKTVTVIDMLGNHESFLLRPRTLLALGLGHPPSARQLALAIRSGAFELPIDCAVELDLRVIDLLAELIDRRRGATDRLVEHVLDCLAEEGRRPSKTEVYRSGFDPGLGAGGKHWFDLLAANDALEDEEVDAVRATRELLARFETALGPATRSYKMVTLRSLLSLGRLRAGAPVRDVVARARELVLRDPRLVADATSASALSDPHAASLREWEAQWMRYPIAALTRAATDAPPLFGVADGTLKANFSVPEEHGEAFDAFVAELTDYRLAKYLADRPAGVEPEDHRPSLLRVSQKAGQPTLLLDRETSGGLPFGEEISVEIGSDRYRAELGDRELRVLRPESETVNVLPDLLRSWFGPDAGQPGTSTHVVAESRGEYWTLSPETDAVGLERHIGQWFRRDAVPALFGESFNPGNWNSGHVSLARDTVLFVTLKGGVYPNELLAREPPRVSRRLLPLREWSHVPVQPFPTRGPRACRSHASRASARLPVHLGRHGFDRREDRLHRRDVASMVEAGSGRCRRDRWHDQRRA